MCYNIWNTPAIHFSKKTFLWNVFIVFSRQNTNQNTLTSKITLKYRQRWTDRISHASPHVAWYSTFAPVIWIFNLAFIILIVGWICMPIHFIDYHDYSQNESNRKKWRKRKHARLRSCLTLLRGILIYIKASQIITKVAVVVE